MKIKRIITLTVLAIAFSNSVFSQVGIGTINPHASAELDVTSTSKGFLPPRLTTEQRNLISGPASGLTIYNTSLRCLDTYNGVIWINCTSIGSTDVYNPVTGRIWMDRNLGATQVATSSTDAASYGHLFNGEEVLMGIK
jgi:hypothetical protein